MIVITESKLQYKAKDGGVTRRVSEHFVKRSVRFEVEGEERRIDINKEDLGISATEEEVISYIRDNIEVSTVANEQLQRMQRTIDTLVMDNLMRGL